MHQVSPLVCLVPKIVDEVSIHVLRKLDIYFSCIADLFDPYCWYVCSIRFSNFNNLNCCAIAVLLLSFKELATEFISCFDSDSQFNRVALLIA